MISRQYIICSCCRVSVFACLCTSVSVCVRTYVFVCLCFMILLGKTKIIGNI